MKIVKLLVLSLMLSAGFVYAQEEAPKPAAAVEEVAETADDKPTVGEVVKEGAAVVEAVEDLKEAKKAGEGLYLVIMALCMAVFKFTLSIVKLTGPFWKGRRGKTVLRLTTVGLGTVVALIAVAMDSGWVNAVTVGLSGPLAVAAHEYSILIPALARKKESAKAEEASG
jgi:hypothetical protein